jgi:hypothetical protein
MHPGELLKSSTSPVATVTLGASPATYLATVAGSLCIAGGTVTAIAHVRSTVSNVLGIISGCVHLRAGDSITVTYAVIPTAVTFLPD